MPPEDGYRAAYYSLQANSTATISAAIICTDNTCTSCSYTLTDLAFGMCQSIKGQSIVVSGVDQTCVGGYVNNAHLYFSAYTMPNTTNTCDAAGAATIDLMDVGVPPLVCQRMVVGNETWFLSVAPNNDSTLKILYHCDPTCDPSQCVVLNNYNYTCSTNKTTGYAVVFQYGNAVPNCGFAPPASSSMPPSPSSTISPTSSSWPSPTPTPTPTPSAIYSLAQYVDADCALSASAALEIVMLADTAAICVPMPDDNASFYALQASGSTFSTFKAYCVDSVCQNCAISVPGIPAGICTNINDFSVILAAVNSTCLGGQFIVPDDIYVVAYDTDNSSACSINVATKIEVLDMGGADGFCRNYTLDDDANFASIGLNGNNYNISFGCEVNCTNCDFSVPDYVVNSCVSSVPGTNYKFVTGDGLNACGQPTPSSSVVPSSTATPTPTPTPSPYGSYSFTLYQIPDCVLPADPKTATRIIKLNATSTCTMMPNGLDGYYKLSVNGKNQASGAVFCDNPDCVGSDCIAINDVAFGNCANSGNSQSLRLAANSQTCLGGDKAVADVIYVVAYEPPDTTSVQSCITADAAIVDVLYLTTPDSACHSYTLNDELNYVKIAPIEGKYDIHFGCDEGCNTCDVVETGYSLGGCITQQPGIAYKFVQGSSISSCLSPAPSPSKKKGGSAAAVAGGVIAGLAAIAGLAFVYVKYIRRRSAVYTPIS